MTMQIQAKLYPNSDVDVAQAKEALERFKGQLELMGANVQHALVVLEGTENFPAPANFSGERRVVKIDGYIHFDEPKTSDLCFGLALAALKSGKKVARAGWNGQGMWAVLQKGYPDGIPINKNTADATGLPEGTVRKFRPFLMLYTAQGDFANWVPSGSDILAGDWVVVE